MHGGRGGSAVGTSQNRAFTVLVFIGKMDAREQIVTRWPVIMQMAYRLPVKMRAKIMRLAGAAAAYRVRRAFSLH